MNLIKLKDKLQIEHYFIKPFVMIGKIVAKFYKLKTKHGIFLVYSNADIGGSTRVNIELAKCLRNKNPLIIFTKKPKNNLFYQKFKDLNIAIIDLHKLIDVKSFHFINMIFRGVVSEWSQQSNIEAIIGGENIYFYKIIPFLDKNIKRIEISHVDAWLNYSIGFHDLIDYRIFSTENLKKKVELQYRHCNMHKNEFEKLKFIENGIEFKALSSTNNERMQVFFIGRGSPQKRVHLAIGIAEIIHQKQIPIDFNFVGDVNNVIAINKYPYCKFYGDVFDEKSMNEIYQKTDVLLLTSAFEGLPIVIMEIMAQGKTVVSTAVDSIPDYIVNNKNGFLIHSKKEEDIIEEGANYIIELNNKHELRAEFGIKNQEIAREKFNLDYFCKNYNELLNTP